MKILITGAKGFVGKNLCTQLKNIRDGKAKNYGLGSREEYLKLETAEGLKPETSQYIEEVFEYDLGNTQEELEKYCEQCDFVFNLAGVNRPQNTEEFMQGNFGFASTLLDTLKKYHNTCPVMLSSSIQATLAGRFGTSEYGISKKAGEELFFEYSKETGAKVLVYRFPNLYGKWCRPNYNSAVATFCNNIVNDLPIQVNDPSVDMELLYVDDLVEEMIDALKGNEHRCEFDGVETVMQSDGRYCAAPVTYKTTLGHIVDTLYACAESIKPTEGTVPAVINYPKGSFEYTLMATFLSYLPKDKAIIDLKMNVDPRGSFTELFHILNGASPEPSRGGQVSINISKPGITKGQHWHNTKWEQFIVVAGHGLIQMRPENPDLKPSETLKPETERIRVGENGVIVYEVSGDKIQSVIMLPGYTHNIINLSDTEDLVTVMYCNEIFDSNRPDTFFDLVEK